MSKTDMKEHDIDRLEDVFRSKLYDFEATTGSEDWEAIARCLPVVKVPVPFYRKLRYWAAAAVITLLMVTGSLYLFKGEMEQQPVVHDVVKQHTEALESRMKEEVAALNAGADKPATVAPTAIEPTTIASSSQKRVLAVVQPIASKSSDTSVAPLITSDELSESLICTKSLELPERVDEQADVEHQLLQAVSTRARSQLAEDAVVETKEKPTRKWRFGMGGGGLSMAADNVVPQYVTNSAGLRAADLQYMNRMAAANDEVRTPLPRTNVKHKVPISFGLAVSRSLNNRFSLQTGVVYSYLLSEWDTNGQYNAKNKQGLHFIGIPLSVNYLIAEWNRFQFYGTGGVMTELNVAGRLNTKLYDGDELVGKVKEDVRMKPLLWSLNARVGVSYPLLRFLSAYAEGGAGYYFDNGSDIETIRSEKPFNVNFQFGLRVGF